MSGGFACPLRSGNARADGTVIPCYAGPLAQHGRGRPWRRRNHVQAAATRAVMRAAEGRAAERLHGRGWICIPPDADLEAMLPVIQPWAARGILGLMFAKRDLEFGKQEA